MVSIKSIVKRHGKTNDPASAHFSESRLPGRTSLNIGRHLAFSIGSTHIQMAATTHFGRRRRTLDVTFAPFPGNLNTPEERAEYLTNSIGMYLARHGGRNPSVFLTVSGCETAFRTFLMPTMKARDLDSAIEYEAEKQIPFPLSECVFGYRPTCKVVAQDRVRHRISLHAATTRYIKEQLDPFRAKGIDVSRIFHAHDVIGELLEDLPDFRDDHSYTLMQVAYDRSEISFYHGSSLEFVQVGSTAASQLGDDPDETRLRFFAESLTRELETAQDFYAGQYARTPSGTVLVYGELAEAPELIERTGAFTSFDFIPFPTERLPYLRNQELSRDEACAVCLPALAASVCRKRLANLLPAEERRRQTKNKLNRWSRISLALVTVVLIASWAIMYRAAADAELTQSRLEDQVADIKNSDTYISYYVLKQQMAADRSYIETTKANPSYFNLNLKQLSLVTPPAVRLTTLDYRPTDSTANLTIHGVASSEDIPPEVVLAEYVEGLRASPFFQKVTVLRHVKRKVQGESVIDFQIGMEGAV